MGNEVYLVDAKLKNCQTAQPPRSIWPLLKYLDPSLLFYLNKPIASLPGPFYFSDKTAAILSHSVFFISG